MSDKYTDIKLGIRSVVTMCLGKNVLHEEAHIFNTICYYIKSIIMNIINVHINHKEVNPLFLLPKFYNCTKLYSWLNMAYSIISPFTLICFYSFIQ